MNYVDKYLFLGLIIYLLLLTLYLLYDFVSIAGGANVFWDKWTKKTIWMWLPFYALWRLTKEVILGKK